jgi:DNA primase
LLLGAQLLHSPRFVILVEGLFDFANMIEMRYPAVATMKSDLSPEQAEILRGYRAPVYVFYDNDQAGQDGLESVKEHLCKHLPVSKVRYPKVKRIRDAETNEMRPPKDPGELLEAEVESMLRDSRLV